MNKPPKSVARNILPRDHRKLQNLLKKYKNPADFPDKEDLAECIAMELNQHLKLEEQKLFPGLKRFPDGKMLIRESLKDHERIKSLLNQLRFHCLDNDSSTYTEKMAELRDCVNQHIQKSEREVLPKVLLLNDRQV